MDSLHAALRAIRPETKGQDHFNVFREFLAHLDRLQRQAVKLPPHQPRQRVKAS